MAEGAQGRPMFGADVRRLVLLLLFRDHGRFTEGDCWEHT